tara:strand:- start:2027 stop:2476 length:450 start_codon:yes stop_codon:yes gene_type:complete
MSELQETIEEILADPARLDPVFSIWGMSADYYLPQPAPAGSHFMDQSQTEPSHYNTDQDPDGTVQVIMTDLYTGRGIRFYNMSPAPGDEYKLYAQKIPDDLVVGSALRFTLKKTGRNRHFWIRIKDVEKIEGVKKVLIKWFVAVPYKWK